MSKLDKIIAFLNDEEIELVEKCMDSEGFRKALKKIKD